MTSQVSSRRASSRRAFLKTTAALGASFVLPAKLFADAEARQDAEGNDVVLRCCVMSDVHFNGSPNAAEVARFKRAIEFMYEYSAAQPYKKFDALVVVGDMSNHGNDAELSLFKKTMDDAVRPETCKLLCMGNHEFYGGNRDFWREKFGVEPEARYEVNGFQFIAISPEKGTMQDGDYLHAYNWVERELQLAADADPNKPIFVFQHYPISPTVYGGRGFDDWGLEDLFDLFQKHPRIVDFSGHTHYPINDPRCAWQGCFSAFGTGTLSYLCHGGEGGKYEKYPANSNICGQFYVLEARRDNSVVLKPYDLITDSFFDVVYCVAEPGAIDKYLYTDARWSTSKKPEWPQDAKIDVLETDEFGALCEFPQATCPDQVHSYRFELERFDAKENAWKHEDNQYFWSEYFQRNPPKRLRVELTSLESDAQYRAKVRAANPFLKHSDRALELEFKTKPDPNDAVDRDAPRPDANILDLQIVDGALVNLAVCKEERRLAVKTMGTPQIVEEPAPDGANVAKFDGSAKYYYKIPCSDDAYRRLRRATIAAKFRADGTRKEGSGAIFGNTEMRGIELSVDYGEKVVKLWASVNGAYKILAAPIKFDVWIEAFGTYDGENLVLYLDGKEVARTKCKGNLTHPTDPKIQAFCFGCDIGPDGGGSFYFSGEIARARLFSWAIKPEQVANLSAQDAK